MPIYEFRCNNCGNIQEFLFKSSGEEVEMKCNECSGEDLQRVLSHVSYSMGSSSASSSSSAAAGGCSSGMCATNRNCGQGNSCSTLTLPGYSKD